MPEEQAGAAHSDSNTDSQAFGAGSAHQHANSDGAGGRIHQTDPHTGMPHPSQSGQSAEQEAAHSHPAHPEHPAQGQSAGQAVKRVGAASGRVASPQSAKNPKKVGANAGSAASRPKEVPKASDTWSEAFRGRVAAINDQVKSLNHKLDEFDK